MPENWRRPPGLLVVYIIVVLETSVFGSKFVFFFEVLS